MQPKIVVTMTSWKQRIATVSKVIMQFFAQQTYKPNIFYLWLSLDEFPNKEDGLPAELVQLSRLGIVRLKWLPGNEYCYKRWHVYPEHYDDFVVSIDDDSCHSPTLISDALEQLAKYKNKAVCNVWRWFSSVPQYDNDIKIKFRYVPIDISPNICTCATCVIPPQTFPLEALSDKVTSFRSKHLPKCDEAWLIPFMLKHDIWTTYIRRPFPYVTVSNEKETCLHANNSDNRDSNGYTVTEKSLYLMLKELSLLEKYAKLFPGYDWRKYESVIGT